ncbi:nitroreductase family protein [Candidatus Bipolaricaulota bacterium]
MNTREVIAARRSIRQFKMDALPKHAVDEILKAASLAPSGKNRQPWRFILVEGEKRAEMMDVMHEMLKQWEERGEDTGSAKWTAEIMAQAPLTVFVMNPHGIDPWEQHSVDQMFQELVDVQSIGAAIQNMALAAQDLDIGSLWICDVLYAISELKQWLGEDGELVAAMSFGYPDEAPEARPRKPMNEIVREL